MERRAAAQSNGMSVPKRQIDAESQNNIAETQRRNAVSVPVLEKIRKILDEGKAENVVVLNIAGRSALADYMVIACGTSGRHLASLADKVLAMLKEQGSGEVKTEGMGSGDWVLLDEGDVIVHLFRPEIRAFYRLEKMWGQANDVEILEEIGVSDAAAEEDSA